MLGEIYRYNGDWRLSIVSKGFDGGLDKLLAHFGGEEVSSPQPKPISLKKSENVQILVLDKAPHLIDLTKKAIVSLEKRNLIDVKAQVVLVLDVSGSMKDQYNKGRVQRILDKVLPLALLFDENSSLESWGFATTYKQLTDATLDNIKDYITKADGGVSQNRKIKELIKTAAYAPIFWQFVGINGKNYGALEKLDEMQDRYVDNANFFALDDIDSISDNALYDRLTNEFPLWLKAANDKHIL